MLKTEQQQRIYRRKKTTDWKSVIQINATNIRANVNITPAFNEET